MSNQQPSKELRDWLDSLPVGPPWMLDDPDPLVSEAVQQGFTTAQPTTSRPLELDTGSSKTKDGSETESRPKELQGHQQ